MNSLLAFLFRGSFWRILRQPDTWRQTRASMLRVHKDKRAWRQVGGIVLLLLLPVAGIAYLAWLVGSGANLLLPFVLPALWWLRRENKRDGQTMTIAPVVAANHAARSLSDEQNKALIRQFAEHALFHAAFVCRAGSERFLKQKELPAGAEVVSRQRYLAVLRDHGLWERLSAVDRSAMMAPDGAWTWEQINTATLGVDQVRVLRWMLGVDYFLPLAGQFPGGGLAQADELVAQPDKVLRATELVDSSDVAPQCEAARAFHLRCYAEGVARGYFPAKNDETAAWARKLSSQLAGNQHEDLLVGSELVSETDPESLRWASALSALRWSFLTRVMQAMKQPHREIDFPIVFSENADDPAQPASPANASESPHSAA